MLACLTLAALAAVATHAAAPLTPALSPQEPQEPSGLSPLGEKPAVTRLTASHEPHLVEVKFTHGSGVRLRDGRFAGASPELESLNEFLDGLGAQRERLFEQSEAWLDAWRASGEARSGKALHDLNTFFRLRLPEAWTGGTVCDVLNGFDVVQLAYPVGRASDPVAPVRIVPALLPETVPAPPRKTPSFQGSQNYREPAPTGVGADWGNRFSGGRGEGHVIADVETGWTDDHEDIRHKALGSFIGLMPPPYPWDHGTAVLGELIGEDNGEGVLGIVHQADVLMSSHLGFSTNIPTAIANGANAIGAGDVLVLEVQCYGTPPGPFPCEYVASTYATVETATANGKHVFAAAGNGDNNLDSPAYGGLFDRNVRDSGAVMCGASDGASLDKAWFSNYGSRLDAHGWGFDVTTTGYGDLYSGGSVTSEYTATFSGTSSATPIVTGAAVILSGVYREAFGSDMDPGMLRGTLALTGTPQGSGGRIGPRPDVRAALDALGVPSLTVSGNLVPGGTVRIDLAAASGDSYVLGFSQTLAPAQSHLPPYGYVAISLPPAQTRSGTVPAGGTATIIESIPNNPALSGTTAGYVQAQITFAGGPGTGSITNYAPIDIQ